MRVLSLNVVYADIPDVGGSVGITAIDKRPVEGPRHVTTDGIAGDHRCDMENHGHTDQAVYAYAREDYDRWSAQLGRELRDGEFGENLTTSGVDWNAIEVGTVVRIGSAVLQVSCPRIPCSTFGRWVQQEQWVKRFNDAGRWNTYRRVVQDGELGAGDDIAIEARPGHGVTVTDVARVYTGNRDHDRLVRVEACDDVDEATRAKARAALDS
mgnify:CR=1 FL=1